jgi:DNA-binding NarL/FixJ family response regulator
MAVSRDVRALLDSLGTDPPQVAILDVEADGEAAVGCSVTEGINLLREARKRRLEVRMLMLSAVSAPEVISQCFDEGASGYLFRAGLGVNAVTNAIQGLVRGERLFPVQLLRNDLEHPPAAPASSSVLQVLTQREREVLCYVAGGADNLKIAAHLQIAERTVKSHVTQLYRKLGAENRTQLALRACHLGVRPPPDL